MSLPGSVCLYQGEELGLANPELAIVKRQEAALNKHDPLGLSADACFPWDAARTPMPWESNETEKSMWLKSPESHQARSVEAQMRDPNSVLAHTQKAIKQRQNTPALRDPGSLEFIETGDTNVVAFVRESAETGQKMLCAFNFTDKAVDIKVPEGVVVIGGDRALINDEGRTLTVQPLSSQFMTVMGPERSAADRVSRSSPRNSGPTM